MKSTAHAMHLVIFFLAITLLPLTGCSIMKGNATGGEDEAGLPPVSVFAGDLKDIELPIELEWDRDKSITIKTESFNGGIWYYAGRVEPLSLKDYLINAMHNNNWKLVGEATAKDILLAFVKPNKTCMIVIEDTKFGKTTLSLHVTIDKTAAAGLNPFGEAVGR